MKYFKSFPRINPLIALAGLYLLLSFILRIVLWWVFGRPTGLVFSDLITILLIGVGNDLLQLVYLLAPLSLYMLLLPDRIFSHPIHKAIFSVATYLIIFGMLYLLPVEYYFFDEFDSRFNLIAVDYLMYPHEVLVNLWESYPIAWILFGNLILSYLVFRLLWPVIRQGFLDTSVWRKRFPLACINLVSIVPLAYFISSDTFWVSDNRVANEISSNGISSLFRALRTEELNYNLYYRTIKQEDAYAHLREQLGALSGQYQSQTADNLTRSYPQSTQGLGKLNVVLLVEESLGAGFIGTYGNTKGLSPNFDKLAKKGLLFKNAYATGTRTVRGLEAITASFPPIPSESILKRPGNENIANWGEVMRGLGYHTSFIYGGFGLFDNMNYFYRNNGFETVDRTDIKKQTFANIWGVCDEDLFNHAIRFYDKLAAKGTPFFSLVMTTSNHKPYTFPEGIEGVPTRGGGRDAGVRYADYAIGRFFEKAPKHKWFKNTIFVVIADHDARVYGRALIPVERYRIPLLVLAPGKIQPQVSEKIISQVDLAPTILGLLGLPFEAPFYGVNVLSENVPAKRPVMISHNHDVALLNGDKLAVLGLQKTFSTYSYDSVTNEQKLIENDMPLIDLATAYYQTAFEQFQGHKYVIEKPVQP